MFGLFKKKEPKPNFNIDKLLIRINERINKAHSENAAMDYKMANSSYNYNGVSHEFWKKEKEKNTLLINELKMILNFIDKQQNGIDV